ncbi:flagellar basal-body rod modification protein FlgD [Paenibacillus sp. 1_12]|uniref:flagellar hook capping FlgD N-terminal domain-containing protein n=1 Tax=Paenibacillus sp. 1_12 TaxID=1566278 RepID=UPI0008E77B3A|nr:flagellar hook capping FlgD N-terminal domain-containing protein [Paenibacillus sp. 1_12]SFL46237.1 flagellar basal-body rod modification protein FlgD [Paenibacillus sp. 1_12]
MSDSPVSTKNVYPYYAKSNVTRAGTDTEKKGQLGKDEFLKILMTQLKNQDPTDPLKDKEFIAQMAQFTSVEQLSNMTTELKLMRQSLGLASSLIGKEVQWSIPSSKSNEEAKIGTGVVESIIMKDGSQYALIKNEQINLDSILRISNPELGAIEE